MPNTTETAALEASENPSADLLEQLPAGADAEAVAWFVMRDLKRGNALRPAYIALGEAGHEVFTPLHWVVSHARGKCVRKEVPVVQNLVFVRTSPLGLAPFLRDTPTLQYRWLRGAYEKPMTVGDGEMERFIRAVRGCDTVRYFLPEEVPPDHIGKHVRIHGGPLDGVEGNLAKLRGAKVKRLYITLPGLLCAEVKIEDGLIEFT